MKLLIAILLISSGSVWSQVSAYSFSQSNATYVPITGGTQVGIATSSTSLDSYTTPAITLPFGFMFNGAAQTTAYMTSNGFMTLGSTSPSTTNTTPISTSSVVANGVVSPWAGDLNTFYNISSRTGEMRWETVGTSPNREIVFQWKDFRPAYTTSSTNVYAFNFQVRLHENGSIRIVYDQGGFVVGSTAVTGSSNRQIGLRGSSTGDYNNRVFTSFSTASTAGGSNSASNSFSTASNFPASGLTLTWTPPTCFSPGGINATALTPTTATINWAAANPVPSSGYEYEVRSSGAAGSGATGLAASGATSSLSANVSGLSANTTYSIYVRSSCGSGTFSGWSAAATFTTPFLGTVPYTEGFTTTTLPTGWNNTSSWTIGTTTAIAGNPGNYIRKNLYSSTTTAEFQTASYGPVTAGQNFSFDYALANFGSPYAPPSTGWGNFVVQVSTNFGATWTTLDTYSGATVAGWVNKSYPLTSYVGSNVSFKLIGNWLAGDYYLAFDNFAIAPPPTCFAPSGLATSSVLSTSATLSWNAASPAPSVGYQYEIRTSGAAGSGSTGLTASGSLSGLSVNLTGLAALTSYTAYVRSDCGAGDYSSWSQVNFSTTIPGDICADATPISCGSNTATSLVNSTNESVAVCGISGVTTQNSAGIWFKFTGNGEDTTISTAASATNVDTRLAVYSGSCGALTCLGGNDDIGGGNLRSEVLISTTVGAQYYILLYSYSGTTPTAAINLTMNCVPACTPATGNDVCANAASLTVGTALSSNNTCASPSGVAYPSCASSFGTYYDTWYSFNSGSNTTLEVSATGISPVVLGYAIYSGACGSLTQVGCNTTGAATNYTFTANTDYYVRVYSMSAGARGNFTLLVKVPCLSATAATISAITQTSATLSWTASTGNPSGGYEYEIRTSGAAGSGATGLTLSGAVAAGTVTAPLSGLSPSTSYTAYVRSVCSVGDYSPWISSATFLTPCDPVIAFPWVETFEADSSTLPCFRVIDGNSDGDAWGLSTVNPRTGLRSARLYTDGHTSNQDYLISPPLTLGSTPKRLRFWVRANSTTEVEEISVKISTAGTAIADFTQTALPSTPVNTTSYVEKVVDLTAFAGPTPIYIAFVRENAPANGWYLNLDDITVEDIPTTITSYSPTAFCAGGGETVTITGAQFTGTTSVSFNGVAAASFTVVNNTTINAVTPAGITAGTISVTSPNGTGTSTDYTVNPMPVVPAITNGNATLCVGGSVTMANAAPGGTWSSANTAVATVDAGGVVTAEGAGTTTISYSVTDLGCTTTVSSPVSVNAPVVISTQPQNQIVLTNTNATFSVQASGDIVGYQWMMSTDFGDTFEPVADGGDFSGATTNTLQIASASEDYNDYVFYVVITAASPCADVESEQAFLTVGNTGVLSHPQDVTLCSTGSGTASFSVVASGSVVSYSWQVFKGASWLTIADGNDAGTTYSGATTANLNVSGLVLANSGWLYKAIISGPANTVETNSALLTINEGATVSAPSAQTVCTTGGSAVFTVTPSGSFSGIQWQYSTDNVNFTDVAANTPVGATYSGAQSNQLTVTTTASTPAAGTYYYRAMVIANAPCANVASSGAQLNIFAPVITSQPTAATAQGFSGNPAIFTVATSASSPTYQWQYSTTAGGTYTNVVNDTPSGVTYSGANSASLTVTAASTAAASTSRYYKVIVTSGGCSTTSNAAQLTISNYCTPAMTVVSASGDYINNFSFADLTNNNSGDAANDYTYYSNLTANVFAGLSYNISLTAGGTSSLYTQQFRVWVDFNHDGDFDDAGESIFATSTATFAPASATGTVTIPAFSATVLPGVTRMRVASRFSTAVGATAYCVGQSQYGEYEDYNINISAIPACSGTPVAGTVATPAGVCQSGSVTLSVSGYATNATGLSYQWYSTATGLIPGATGFTYTTPVLSANASYFFRVSCSGSGLSADSNTVTVNVSNPAIAGTSPAARCGTGTVELGATASAGNSVAWYAAATGGVPLATGSTFTTPSIAATTTYYAAAESVAGGTVTIGTATTLTGATAQPTAFCNRFAVYRGQYIVTAAELNEAGLRAGNITSVSFNITTLGDSASNTNFKVSMGTIGTSIFPSTTFATGLTEVFSAATYTHAVGVNTIVFNTPYNWDGVSNIVVEVTHNGIDSANNARTYYTATAGNTVLYYISSTASSTSTTGTASTNRLNMNFGGSVVCASTRSAVVATVNTPPALTLSTGTAAICNGSSTGTVTLTSAVGDYDTYVWSPSTGVSGNIGSGFTFNPTVSTVYTLTASQTGGSLCSTTATLNVTVNPLPPTPVITPASATVCAGDITALSAGSSAPSGTAIFGTGTTAPGVTAYPNPLSAYYGGAKHQMIVLASELTAQGLGSGSTISSVSFNLSAINTSGACADFTIRMGTTSLTALTDFVSGTTAVYGPTTFTPSATGLVTFNLTTPFVWNGTSNLIVETIHNQGNGGNGNGTRTLVTTTPTNTVFYGAKDNVAGGIAGFDAAAPYSSTGASASRPNMRFGFTNPMITWTPSAGLYSDAAATVPYAGQSLGTVYAKPMTSTSYTATFANSFGCSTVGTPASITVNQYYDFYVDADGDGYGTGSAVSFCAASATTPPAGYAAVAGDCDDTVATINPGQAEIPYNGIDDNCNGTIDEGSQVYSQVLASQCGTTLTSISSLIGAVSYGAPVNGYRFKVINTATNAVQIIDRTVPNFAVTMLPTYDYAVTYSISVMLRRNGIWLNYYGPSCLVSTPAILDPGGAAAVSPSQCGIVLPSISTLIATTSIPNVTGYRFRVTNLTDATAPNEVQILDRTLHWFSLTMLTRFNYGTTYQVEVAVKTNGAYSGYGAPCTVSSPAVPMLANCGAVIASAGALVSTASMNRATAYRFEITNLSSGNFEQITVDRSSNWFTFNNVPGYQPGGLYAVRVALQTSGFWSPFSEACEITAPGAARTVVKGEEATPAVEFRAVVYPNPYVESFALDMDTSSEEKVQVKVYDMIGKLLEDREFEVDMIEMQQFGERYPSGVYNIVVTQASFVKTLRVIKR